MSAGAAGTITVKCTYADGNTVVTGINATFEEAKAYFLGQSFNFGDRDFGDPDNMQECVKVELVSDPQDRREG